MSTTKGKRTDEELAEAMRYLLYDHEPETPEEIDAFLRSEGLDPEEIADYGRKLAERELAVSPLNWRNRGPEREQAEKELLSQQVPPDMPREDMLTKIRQLLATLSPRQMTQVGIEFRNYEELSEVDLRSLLSELRYLGLDQ